MAIRTGRIVTWVVVAGVFVALGLALRPAPVPVDLGTVDRGRLRVTLDEEARRASTTASSSRRRWPAACCASSSNRATR